MRRPSWSVATRLRLTKLVLLAVSVGSHYQPGVGGYVPMAIWKSVVLFAPLAVATAIAACGGGSSETPPPVDPSAAASASATPMAAESAAPAATPEPAPPPAPAAAPEPAPAASAAPTVET